MLITTDDHSILVPRCRRGTYCMVNNIRGDVVARKIED